MAVRRRYRALAALVCSAAVTLGAGGAAGAAQFSDVAAGGTTTCATKGNGQLYCWGNGHDGQLGRLETVGEKKPVQVIGTYDSVQVSGGVDYFCQIHARGIFSCWGMNKSGQLGNGRIDRALYPFEVREPAGLSHIETGYASTCAIGQGGGVWCWGDDYVGQLGDGSAVPYALNPQAVPGVSGITDLAIGDKHACAVRNDGAVLCWGSPLDGRIVVDSPPVVPPTVIPGISDAAAVTAGTAHTCVLKRDGTVWCFGQNDRGQLGIGGQPGASVSTPTQVPGLSGITQIDAGGLTTCAVGQGGAVWCWGAGNVGQLGDGKKTDSTSPVQVANVSDVSKLSVGLNHACVLTSKGAPFCWGSNRYGQIGNGDRTGVGVTVRTPTRVVDYVLGRATFVPRALISFPTGTSGGVIELRKLILRKTSTRYSCPKSATISITAKGKTARRKVAVTKRDKSSCYADGSYALANGTDGATKASYAVRGTHVRTASASLRAQRGS